MLIVIEAATWACQRSAVIHKNVNSTTPVPGRNLLSNEILQEITVRVTQQEAILARSLPGDTQPAKIMPGRLVQGPYPAYPPTGPIPDAGSQVETEILVNERGVVEDVRIVAGEKVLADEVTSALFHWRYTPFRLQDQAVAVRLPLTVEFQRKVPKP